MSDLRAAVNAELYDWEVEREPALAVLAIIDAHRCYDEAALAEALCWTQDRCDGTCPDVEGAVAIHGKYAAAIIERLR
jgi:hypothetical protein